MNTCICLLQNSFKSGVHSNLYKRLKLFMTYSRYRFQKFISTFLKNSFGTTGITRKKIINYRCFLMLQEPPLCKGLMKTDSSPYLIFQITAETNIKLTVCQQSLSSAICSRSSTIIECIVHAASSEWMMSSRLVTPPVSNPPHTPSISYSSTDHAFAIPTFPDLPESTFESSVVAVSL